MNENGITDRLRLGSLMVMAPLVLAACLSEEEGTDERPAPLSAVRLSGSVGDGPVINASISVQSLSGELVVEGSSDAQARYEVIAEASETQYPLMIVSRGGLDLVSDRGPDFELLGIAAEPGQSTIANVNPYTTFVVEVARDLAGGITSNNASLAQAQVEANLDFGLMTLSANGALATPINGSNVAEIIKASEALGESVRRVRDRLNQIGQQANGDTVIRAIASDLVDGDIDGEGGPRVDARTAALMTVIAAEVALEALQNELRVYGVNATQAMEDAAAVVNGGAPSTGISDLPVTEDMIRIAIDGLTAGATISSDPAIQTLINALGGVQSGSNPVLVRSLIPDSYSTTTDALVSAVATASGAEIDALNAVAGGQNPQDPVNRAPVIAGTPPLLVAAGENYSFLPTANDADGDTLVFSVSQQPSWAQFDTTNGRLSGTPAIADTGNYTNIVISVTDGQASAELPAFTISVTDGQGGDTPPAISGTPAGTVQAGSAYVFQPTASDADGDTLSFSIIGLPSWASFNPNNGFLSGTPAEADVGTDTGIEISVSDGTDSTSLPPFSITVETAIVPNTPPTISGSPTTSVTAGSAYAFQPAASDADGDSLTFSISGQPAWATFDSSSGELAGTPGDADVGVYANIVISVSDGTDSSSLPAFDISVDAMSLGSTTLNWTPPTLNEDGTALTDLAGYRIYWGTTPGDYPNSLTINGTGQTTAVIDNLAPGDYYFVMTAFNSADEESRYSGILSRTIN